MDLQMDALLPEGPLQPTASSFMRRGFSAEALPRHFGVQQVGLLDCPVFACSTVRLPILHSIVLQPHTWQWHLNDY